MQIGFFSTDWSQSPAIDEEKSRITGRQEVIPGKTTLTFGGTFLQRGAMPAMELNKHGYDNHLAWRFQVAPDGHIQTMDMNGDWQDPDIWYSQRWMSKDGAEQVKRARATGQVCLADLDDAFHSLPRSNVAHASTDAKNNPDFNRDHYWKMLAECDAVTVSTEPLRREMERIGVPAFVVRNSINLEQWQPNNHLTDELMISWVGGIAWRAHDLHVLRAAGLPGFLAEHGLPMFHAGDSQDPNVPKFYTQIGIDPQVTKCVVAPLCHVAEYPRMWDPVGISLVPLERCAFNESKSFLKSLESCAKGVPYIVSAGFPEQQILIDEGSAGRVAKNEKPRQWLDHLYDLLDPEVRREEGAINRKIAEQHDIKDRWTDWDEVYKQLV